MQINSPQKLDVYKLAYSLAMDIYKCSIAWPSEEKFALIGQIRRSSRSVCGNLSEAWAKRRYEAHFISKLTDADGENTETETWIDFAHDCGYIDGAQHRDFRFRARSIGKMLGAMINNPTPFIIKDKNESK